MVEQTLTDQIFLKVEKELLARLEGSDCEECGRSSVTIAELECIRKWLNDHGYLRPASDYEPGETKRPSLTHGTPFTEPDVPTKAAAGG